MANESSIARLLAADELSVHLTADLFSVYFLMQLETI